MKRLFVFIAFACAFLFAGVAQSQTPEFKSVGNEEFAQIISKKKVQVVDVRTSKEFETGHLKNAVNMDVMKAEFNTQIEQLKKKAPVAVYCKSGKRSKMAAKKLASLGYEVYELDKGIAAWDGEIEQ